MQHIDAPAGRCAKLLLLGLLLVSPCVAAEARADGAATDPPRSDSLSAAANSHRDASVPTSRNDSAADESMLQAEAQAQEDREGAAADVTCRIRDPRGHTVQLERLAAPWDDWPALCATLVNYIKLPAGAVDPNMLRQVESNLMPLGYFETIDCTQTAPMALACQLTPAHMVKSYSLHGSVPFTLLQEDLRRRIFLRPGTIVHQPEVEIPKQADRLRAYLAGEGYYDAQVAITPTVVQGVEPNVGLHLAVTSEPGHVAEVGEIAVRGDSVVPDAVLASIFRHKWIVGVPMRFRPAQFNDDLLAATRRVQQAGWPAAHVQGTYTFDRARRRVNIALQVAAGMQVDVRFTGNTALSDRALRKLADFEAAGAVDTVAVEAMRSKIVRRYQGKGYVDVDVQATNTRRDDALEVHFSITPGRRLPLRTVRVVGLPAAERDTVRQHVDCLTRPASWWRNRYWIDSHVLRDVRALQRAIRQEGFAEAEVTAQRQVTADGTAIEATFLVNPGPQRHVGRVEFDAQDAPFNPDDMLSRLTQRPTRPYVADAVHNDAQEIQASLVSRGYTAAEVTDAVQPRSLAPGAPGGPTAQAVDIKYTLHLGPKARLGGLFLRGNLRTARGVLEQEMHSRAGDALDLAALGAARRRLRAFNIFNTVQLSPLTPHAEDPTTWLLLALEEREVRSLDGVASYSSDYRFSVGLDYRDRNVFGRTMLLTVQLRLANATELLTPALRIGNQDLLNINLKAPRPFGLPIDAEASLLYRYQDVYEFRERRMGGVGSIGRPLLKRGRCKLCPNVAGKFGYELTEAYRIDNLDASSDALTNLPNTTIARFIPSINVNRRDSPIDPTQGYNADLRLELGHPAFAGLLHANASAFWRLLAGVQGFVPLGVPLSYHLDENRVLGGPLVLAAAVQYNAAGPWTGHGAVPTSETFGYGGDFSVRGLVNRASSQQIDNAHYMLTGSAELRWYAVPNLGFGTLQLAGFVDFGSVASQLGGLLQQNTVSVGPVLRYVTPIGPLSLAYGRAISLPQALRAAPGSAPPHGRLHLTFGYSF